LFEKDNCVIRVGHCPAAMPPRELGDQACFAYRRVDGLDDYFAQVQAQGGRILKQADR
jgi:predicted enzyme related to lactoylglutathione lyase